jgi:hypothetical protein
MRSPLLLILVAACGGAPAAERAGPATPEAPATAEVVVRRQCDRIDVSEEYTETFHFEGGRLVEVVTISDRGGTTTVERFERDSLGRVVRTESREEEMDGELHVCTHAWEAIEGGWTERRDCPSMDGESSYTHRYDAEGRRIHYAPDAGPTMEARCIYEEGRLAAVEQGGARSTVERDAEGRIAALLFEEEGTTDRTTFRRSEGRIEVQQVIDDTEEPTLVIYRGDCEDLIVPACAAALAPPPPARSD